MIREIRKRMANQKGFTLVELVVVIVILGILAAIAIPRLTDSTVRANTSRIAADLRTLDSAITMYNTDHGNMPSTFNDLLGGGTNSSYIAAVPNPPSGTCYINGTKTTITATTYNFNTTANRADFQGAFAEGLKK